MAGKLLANSMYDEPVNWKKRLKLPVIVGLVFLAIGGVSYKFYNYQAERAVSVFLDQIFSAQFDAAYANWELTDSNYSMKDFLTDWGKDGYYTKGRTSGEVIDSNSRGTWVVVYVSIDPERRPIALRVDKETLKLSFSPSSKY
jgi:hypothetical protein